MLVAPSHEMVQSEGDFVGMDRTPGDNALQLDARKGTGNGLKPALARAGGMGGFEAYPAEHFRRFAPSI
jgi:hypothetical protein